MTVKLIFPLMLALLLAGCMTDGPSPQKIAAAKAECNGTTTPVAHAKCLNDVERREFPDPYPDLANIVYSARVDLAKKVEVKQMTPEAAEFEFSKIVAQVHDEEQRRAGATAAANQAAMDSFGAAIAERRKGLAINQPANVNHHEGGLLKRRGFAGQLHSSLKGGSLEQGGIDGLTAPAPPLDADTPLDAAPLLGVDTRRDP